VGVLREQCSLVEPAGFHPGRLHQTKMPPQGWRIEGSFEGGNVSVSPCGDPAILRRMRLRTASALMRTGVQPDVHWTSGCVNVSRCLREALIPRIGSRPPTAERLASHLKFTGLRMVEPAATHPCRLHQIKMPPIRWHFYLVEAAGIEPASASPTQAVLHA